jgi:hypothetical protein
VKKPEKPAPALTKKTGFFTCSMAATKFFRKNPVSGYPCVSPAPALTKETGFFTCSMAATNFLVKNPVSGYPCVSPNLFNLFHPDFIFICQTEL